MKRWIALAASLYPRTWREQFADEFAALLDDVKPGWRVFANVLGGAIRMQITTGANWIKLVAATAILGVILAGGLSFTVARNYVSTATISITPQPDPIRPTTPQALRKRAAERVLEIQNVMLSRTSFAAIIADPKFDLYKKERRSRPFEDVIDDMRRDILIQVRPSTEKDLSPMVLDISFSYPDQVKSQAIVRELEKGFAERSLVTDREHKNAYRSFWHDESVVNHTKPAPPPPVGDLLIDLNPASLPKDSPGPSRVVFLAWGLGAGLRLGLLATVAMRWPRGMLQLSCFAAAGCVLAGALSFLIPNRYTYTAVMMIAPAVISEDPLAALPPATSDRVPSPNGTANIELPETFFDGSRSEARSLFTGTHSKTNGRRGADYARPRSSYYRSESGGKRYNAGIPYFLLISQQSQSAAGCTDPDNQVFRGIYQ